MKFINQKRVTKTNRQDEENNIRHMIFLLFAFLLLLPGALMISTSIQASHQGSQLSDVQNQISALEREVRDLQSEIVTNTSLSEVSENAEQMGFKAPENLVYIQNETSVAQLQ